MKGNYNKKIETNKIKLLSLMIPYKVKAWWYWADYVMCKTGKKYEELSEKDIRKDEAGPIEDIINGINYTTKQVLVGDKWLPINRVYVVVDGFDNDYNEDYTKLLSQKDINKLSSMCDVKIKVKSDYQEYEAMCITEIIKNMSTLIDMCMKNKINIYNVPIDY